MSDTPPEHEIETFLRVQSTLDMLDSDLRVKVGGRLVDALSRISGYPFVAYSVPSSNAKITIAGVEAGDLNNLNVDVVMEKSNVSSFGRGEKTVMDLDYRKGREISGADIKMGYTNWDLDLTSATMFVGRNVKVNLHKLAIYEPGGHFDWHMDSTHSDEHHATILIALNTVWKGGDLVLRRNGIERRVSMQPTTEERDTLLQVVMFYTDTEHKVEPVTEGIRIVLQYDVEVTGWAEKDKDGGEEPADDEKNYKGDIDEEEIDEEDIDEEDIYGYFDDVTNIYYNRQNKVGATTVFSDDASIKRVVEIIEKSLESGEEEVAFALQHLYRKSSIRPTFLKGSDSQLYAALADRFDVTLGAVVLHGSTDWDGRYDKYYVHRYDNFTQAKTKDLLFHVPKSSGIELISSNHYIEHTGNEPQPGEQKYFGSGMFVRQKKVIDLE
jgi:hypothetical protein